MEKLSEILYLLNQSPVSTSTILFRGLMNEILSITKFLDTNYEDIPNRQRYWHIKNNEYNLIKCQCGINNKNWHKSRGYVSCSRSCANIKSFKTYKDKTGFDNPMKSEESRNKMIITNNKKYGSNSFLNSKSFENKMGFINPMKSENIKNKRTESVKKKYGVDHTSKSENIKKKISDKIISMKDHLVQENIKSCMGKYGVPNAMMADNHIKNKLIADINKNSIKYNTERFTLLNYAFNRFIFSDKNHGDIFEITKGTYKHRMLKGYDINTNIYPENETNSFGEEQICEYLDDVEYIKNDKTILKPQELDIFIPNHNLAIEFNGLYWHSEKFKNANYHQIKSKICLEKGIQLLHIWEDDWLYRQEIVKSIINGYLGKHERIFARKCEIKEIQAKDCKIFINSSHIQGFVPASEYYGLYYQEELVEVMTFKRINDNDWEISRLCSKLNTQVIGGASKLFKHFINKIDFNSLISYNNNDYFSGNIYEKFGMKFDGITQPNYKYFGNMGDILSRQKCQKKKLIKSGFNPNVSSHRIMLERGYLRIYNSGNNRYIIKK